MAETWDLQILQVAENMGWNSTDSWDFAQINQITEITSPTPRLSTLVPDHSIFMSRYLA